jgi:transposase
MSKRGGKRRDPLSEKYWRRTIRDQQRSGLAVRAFCLREGLKDWTFRWWRQELARRDRETSAASRGEQQGEPTESVPAFLPVRVADLEAILPRQPSPIEIVLTTGPVVRVPFGFDPSTLGQILAVLEGRPC